MNIYLIAYDLKNKDQKSLRNFLSSLGDTVSVNDHSIFLAVNGLTEEDIHLFMRKQFDLEDQWTITKLNESFSGYSIDTESIRSFLKDHPLSFQ